MQAYQKKKVPYLDTFFFFCLAEASLYAFSVN